MINTYPEVKVPSHISKEHYDMNKKEVREFFNWYMDIKNERLKVFYNVVFETHKVKLSADLLQGIFYFLRDNVATRERTPHEIEIERMKLPEPLRRIHKVPDYELIEPSYSMIFDTGIYFGELLRKEVPGVEWTPEYDKEMAFYGRPILVKKGEPETLSPQWIIHGVLVNIVEDTAQEDRLGELFNTWKDGFEGKMPDFSDIIGKK